MLRSLACLVACAACTHHHRIEKASEVRDEWVTVATPHGEVEAFAAPHPFGVVYQRADGRMVRAESVVRVTRRDRTRGAFEGAGFGVVIGAVGGAAVGYAAAEEDDSFLCILVCSKNEGAAYGGLAFGLAGAVVGAVIGGVRGSRVVYEAETASVRLGGPAGSAAGMTVAF